MPGKTNNRRCTRLISDDDPDGQVCGAPVSGGGNVHKIGHCPTPHNPGNNRHARSQKARAKRKEVQAVKRNRDAQISVGSKGAKTRKRKGAGKKEKKAG